MDELLLYIENLKQNGVPDEIIVQDLLNQGYTLEIIGNAFSILEAQSPPASLWSLLADRLGIPPLGNKGILAVVVLGVVLSVAVMAQAGGILFNNDTSTGNNPTAELTANKTEVPAPEPEKEKISEVTPKPPVKKPAASTPPTTASKPPAKPIPLHCMNIPVVNGDFSKLPFTVYSFSCIPSYNEADHAIVPYYIAAQKLAEVDMITNHKVGEGTDVYTVFQRQPHSDFNPPKNCALHSGTVVNCTAHGTTPGGMKVYMPTDKKNILVFKKDGTIIWVTVSPQLPPKSIIYEMIDRLKPVVP